MHERPADIYVEQCDEDKTEPGEGHRCDESQQVHVWDQGSSSRDWQLDSDENNEGLWDFGRAEYFCACSGMVQRDIKTQVHGDDFVSSGDRSELGWLCRSLQKKFETKMIMVGEDDDLDKEAGVLNRIARWHPHKGITYAADPRQAEIIGRETDEAKPISTPAAKEMDV